MGREYQWVECKSAESMEKLAKAAIVGPQQAPPCFFSSCCFHSLYLSAVPASNSTTSILVLLFIGARARRSRYRKLCLRLDFPSGFRELK